MRLRIASAVLAIVAATPILACTMVSEPVERVANPVVYSANGRFCAVVRWHQEIADFGDGLPKLDPPEAPYPQTVTAAVYETRGRQLLGEIPIDIVRAGNVMLSDSGRYLVTYGSPGGGCIRPQVTVDDPLITVYRTNGTRAGALNFGDVFSASDVLQLGGGVYTGLRAESDTRDVIVLTVMRNGSAVERRVDVATATPLDEMRDIFPRPRAYAVPVTRSDDLFSRAVFGPLPEFPSIAIKARIRGFVDVELVVSERGDVLSARSSPLPFGLDAAAAEAARHWRFRGSNTGFTGKLRFQFRDVDEETWTALLREAPPIE